MAFDLSNRPVHLVYTAGTYTVPITSYFSLVVCDTTAGAINLKLPASSAVPLAVVEVKKRNSGTNAIVITGGTAGGVTDLVEAVASYSIVTANRGGVSLRSDGAGAWWAVPYAQPIASNVAMLPAATPGLSANGIGTATITLNPRSIDSVGQITVGGGGIALALAGTLTLTFANPAAFAAVPVGFAIAALFPAGSTAPSQTVPVYPTCSAAGMAITLPALTLPINGSMVINYRCDGPAAN